MRFYLSIITAVFALISSLAYAEGYSSTYLQCINNTYGDLDVAAKCVKKEQKRQDKLLKKYYKNILAHTASEYLENVKLQHQLWENQQQRQCGLVLDSDFGRLQNAKCTLEMTMQRVYYYKNKQIGYS